MRPRSPSRGRAHCDYWMEGLLSPGIAASQSRTSPISRLHSHVLANGTFLVPIVEFRAVGSTARRWAQDCDNHLGRRLDSMTRRTSADTLGLAHIQRQAKRVRQASLRAGDRQVVRAGWRAGVTPSASPSAPTPTASAATRPKSENYKNRQKRRQSSSPARGCRMHRQQQNQYRDPHRQMRPAARWKNTPLGEHQ